MKTLIDALVAFVIVILAPMVTCDAVFKLGFRSGEIVCGHNAWIQFVVLSLVGFVVVLTRAVRRRKAIDEGP